MARKKSTGGTRKPSPQQEPGKRPRPINSKKKR